MPWYGSSLVLSSFIYCSDYKLLVIHYIHLWLLIHHLYLRFGHIFSHIFCCFELGFWDKLLCCWWGSFVCCVMISCVFATINRCGSKLWVRIVVITGLITLIISGWIIVRTIIIVVSIIIIFLNFITISIGECYSRGIIVVKSTDTMDFIIWHG